MMEIVTESQYDRSLRIQEDMTEAAKADAAARLELDRADFEFRKEAHATWRDAVDRQSAAFERIAEAVERLAPTP